MAAAPKKVVDVSKLNPQNPEDLQTLIAFHNHVLEQKEEVEAMKAALETEKANRPLPSTQGQGNSELRPVLGFLADQISYTNLSSEVRPFGGNPKKLLDFFKDIEKYVFNTHNKVDSEACIKIAYRMARQTVSDFIGRHLRDHPHIGWVELKKELTDRFGDKTDNQTRLISLRKYTQKPDQGAQVFAEVILSKAADIFTPQDLSNWFIQKELVGIFAKGLRSRVVARRVMNKNPATLSQAVAEANQATERDLRLKAYGLDERVEEDMDVTVVTSRPTSSKTNGQVKGKPFASNEKAKLAHKWQDGKPVCNGCNRVGHMYRECPRKSQRKTLN